MLHLIETIPETILDGEGIRYSIYLAGCAHHCVGCHNPTSHDPLTGLPLTDEVIDKIITEILDNPLLDGITLTGGDPMFAPVETLHLLRRLKEETRLNIWLYTGYTLEQILADCLRKPLLQYIDTLVDGPFIQSLHDPRLHFRGSSNQRILPLHSKVLL